MGFAINPPDPAGIHPTTFKVRKPLAPNPTGPGPQDLGGATSFTSPQPEPQRARRFTTEMLGAQGHISANQTSSARIIDAIAPKNHTDGKLMPSAIHRTDTTVGHHIAPVPTYYDEL